MPAHDSLETPPAADRAHRRRKALPDHGAQIRARADPPLRARDGRGRRFPQGHHPPVLRNGPHGDRDPRRVRRTGRHLLPGRPGRGGTLRGRPLGRRDRGRAEHHLQQRAAALGHAGAEGQIPAAPGREHGGVLRALGSRLGLRRLRHGDARRGPRRPLPAQPAASCGSPTPPKPASSCCSPTPIPRPDTGASPRS